MNPFAHPRVIIDNYIFAVALLRHFLDTIASKTIMLRPDLILHPTRPLEGGLSDIERDGLLDLGADAGASRVGVHVGALLTAEDVAAFRCEVVDDTASRKR